MGFFRKKQDLDQPAADSVDFEQLPRHIAIVMDGNGRWAKKRGLPRRAGHAAGAEVFRTIATYCKNIGLDYLTVYAFSTENWKRPQDEVDAIMGLFENIVMYLWSSGVQILIFLAAVQKIDTSLYEAAKMDGGSTWECFWKITLPTIKPMTLLNVVYTIVYLSNNEQNSIIETIRNAMFGTTGSKGYGYASAMAWLYAVIVTVLVLAFAAALALKKDIYAKKTRLYKKEQKKQERLIKRIERRGERYEKQKARRAAKSAKAVR